MSAAVKATNLGGIFQHETALTSTFQRRHNMKMALALTVLVLAAVGIPSAQAAPFAPRPATDAGGLVRVWGGCGWGWHPVPGHWTYWGGWVPPHCIPDQRWGGYGNGYWNGTGHGHSSERHGDEDEDGD